MMLRDKVLAVLVFVVLVAAFLIPAYVGRRIADSQFEIACISAEANISQLHALEAVAHELGLPGDIEIPEIPPECDHV